MPEIQTQGIRRLERYKETCHLSISQKTSQVAQQKHFQQYYLRREAILDILLTGPGKASANLSLSIGALVIIMVRR